MVTILGTSAAPSFDDPLEMLLACHGRIQAQCATLRKLQQHLPIHGCDAQAQQAAKAILRYFDSAGQHHHQDEEQDLFPQLLATTDSVVHALVQRLLIEHKDMESAWRKLHPLLFLIAEGKADTLDHSIAEELIRVYDEHIVIENGQLLPLAKTLLIPAQLEIIGRSMAARRGVDWIV
jgi:hemerythrin-like domain-containing protein